MNKSLNIPQLNEEQLRVLGVLMEKCKTTPDYYPLTLNGILAGCNQKTSRKPVVNYDEETISTALNSLKILGLISTATGGSIRAIKYKHNFAIVYPLVPSEVAIICILFLRGPQTPGEINTNSGRLHEFETLEEISQALEKLIEGGYVKQLPKRPGQKEQRYTHLFMGDIEIEDIEESSVQRKSTEVLEERLTIVEAELAELKEKVAKLFNELY